MKLTPKLALALALTVAGLASVAAGTLKQQPLVTAAGWLALAGCVLLVVLVTYRHVVALTDLVRHLAGQSREYSRAVGKQFKRVEAAQESQARLLSDIKALHASLAQQQVELRAQLQRLEETARASSRQSADGQHFVLGAFRQLSERVDSMVASIADAQKESRRLVKHVDEKSAATITEVVKSRDGTASTLELVQSKVVSEIGRSRTETLHETEAMLQLMQLFDLVTTVPLLGGWAMEPSSMLSLVTTILQRKPELVVECGSGTSTIWLAYALAANGKGRLVSLDHEAEYASATRRAVAAHGLENIVDVRLASLVPHPIGDEQFLWYDAAQWNDLRHIDVLIVDGPPSATGPLARYPALPLLGDYLSDRALVVVDDANRKDEKTIMRRWKSELPGVGDPAHLASRTSSIEFQRVLD